MFDEKSLDHLGPIADEMLGGLHADDAMRLKIKRAVAEGGIKHQKSAALRLAPALCCAALALVCVGVAGVRLNSRDTALDAGVMPISETIAMEAVEIDTIAAGEGVEAEAGVMLAGIGDGAKVRMAAPTHESLFASGDGDMPMVAVESGVYRMLKTPKDIGSSLLGGEVGCVNVFTDEPSLAGKQEMKKGLSNVAAEGSTIYKVSGLPASTMVAAEVDGRMRLFQRVSYAGKGPGSESLEDTFCVRGKVKEATLSGVGTLSGSAANKVIGVLLDQATLKSADASARKQSLTVTLENGLKLQLGVSGDTLCGCGGWSCPEFFEAFEAAL